jgi:ABC-2 type transport system permease protein
VKHLLLLLKIQILGFFGINRLFHEKKAKIKTFFIVLGTMLLGLVFASYSVMIAAGCAGLGMKSAIPALMLLICTMLSFFAFITQSSNVLFGFQDYELLMSLPVKKSAIVVSRLCYLYVMEFVFALVFLLPALVVYGIFEGTSVLVWVMICLSPLIVPLLPMTAAFILGTAISLCSIRFRHRNAVTVILSMGIVIAITVGSFSLRTAGEAEMAALVTGLESRIFRFYPLAVLYDLSITGGSVLHFMVFAFLSCVPPALFAIILAKSYGRINSFMSAVKGRGAYHLETTRNNSRNPFFALYVRELQRLGASPVYMLNTGIGAVFLILTAVYLLFTGAASFLSGSGMPLSLEGLSCAFPLLLAFFAALSPSTAAGISLEGKTRWIISSLPEKTGKLFAAKIALNLTITVPAVLIAAVLSARTYSLAGIPVVFMFITPVVYSLLTAVLGLAINLRFPKYDWTREQQAVKQSASVMLSMLAGFAAVLLPVFLIFAFLQYAEIILVLATCAAALGAALLYRRISSRRYYGFT